MADVEALDAQRRLVELEGVLELLERLAASREVAGARDLVAGEALRRVAGDRLHEGALVAAARHPEVDPAAAQPGQPLGEGLGVVGEHGHEHLAGHALARLTAVDLLEQVLDDVGRRLGVALGDPAALSADATAADVEELHRDLELVLGEGEHVGVGGVGQHDRRLLEDPLERADVVAQAGGALEVELGGGRLHLSGQPAEEATGLTRHEVAEVLGDLAVPLRVDPADAGRAALVDVAEQAGTPDLAGALEHPR